MNKILAIGIVSATLAACSGSGTTSTSSDLASSSSRVVVSSTSAMLSSASASAQSSSPQQSSTPASSAPVASSSTSFSSVGIVADIKRGKDQAEALCLGCHGANDWTITDANRAQLISDTNTLMPPTNSALCGLQCATDVIAYLEDLQSNTSSSSSIGSGSPPHIEGQAIFDAQCQSCHSGARTTGVFRDGDYDLAIAKLIEKGLYSQSALSTYIAQEMPQNNAAKCNADCADKVTAYIASWHILPIDPQFADTSLPRSQPERKALSCGQAQGYGERLVRMLTREEYTNTVRDLLGYSDGALSSFLPQDDTRGKFVNNKNITLRTDIEYSSAVQLAEAIAQQAKDTNFTWLNCASIDDTCAQRLVNEYGTYIFRRPLTAAEKNGSTGVAGYLSIARGEHTGGDIAEGMKVALGAMLSSPQFLYRHEMGEVASGAYQLSSYEMASFLSYTFTRSTPIPGSSLWQAAENNQLNSTATIRAEAGKLLATDAAKAIMGELVHDWLSTRSVLKSNKDEALFGDFDPIAKDMVTELSELFKNVMLDENATFADLYAPGKTYVNSRLAKHYGIDGINGNGFQEVATADRGGLLLNGAFLAYRGDPAETSPIRRATYIRRDMLCQYMPPPPAGVSTARDSQKEAIETFINDVRTTNRAAFHRLTESTTCAECHSELINPLGFGLEDYDSVGRLRSVDNAGNAIDASGAFFSPFMELHFFGDEGRNTEHYSFNGGQELATMLASGEASGLAKSCVAMQFYNYATGIVVDSITESGNPLADTLSQDEVSGYGCDINNMVIEITQDSPRAMLEALGTLNSIRFRKAL